MKCPYFVPFLLLIAFADDVAAQNKRDSVPANQLEEIRISAFHLNDNLQNAPAAIGIITEKDLQRNNNADISVAINRTSGVFMQSGAYNTNRISIRGIGARTPYGTNKIRAFYGNIPLTSGDSETTIDDIDVENIGQIEIIKGPLSSLYGAGLGGAILLKPKLYEMPGGNVHISTTHGSYGLMKNVVNYSLNRQSSSLNVSYHKLETDGWRENSSYKREAVTLAGELFKKPKSKLAYFANYTFLKAYIPSSIDKNTFGNNPRAAALTWKSAKGFEQYDSYSGGLAYESEIFGHIKNATSFFVSHKESDEPRPFDILRQNTTAYGARTQFSGDLGLRKKMSFIVGLEYFRDNFKGKTFENLYEDNNNHGSLQGNQLTEVFQNRTFYNVFAQFRRLISAKVEIQAGLNINKTKFDLNNTLPTTEDSKQQYGYDAIWSPQISILYKPTPLKMFYASISRGFSMPAIEETMNENGSINPNIKPENGYNFEIGGKFHFLNKLLYTEVALYRMEIKDLLVAQRIGYDQYIGANAGKTLHEGIEILIHYTWNCNRFLVVKPYFSGSFGNYKFKEFLNNGADFSGNELTGVPKNKINAGISFESNFGLYLWADFQFVDKMPLNDSNTDYNDAWHILNLKTGWQFKIFNRFSSDLSAGINNVFDEHYAAMVLVNATAFGNAKPRFYYPGLPVNYYVNLSFSYAL